MTEGIRAMGTTPAACVPRPVLTHAQTRNFRCDCCEELPEASTGPVPLSQSRRCWDTCPWSLPELHCSYTSAWPPLPHLNSALNTLIWLWGLISDLLHHCSLARSSLGCWLTLSLEPVLSLTWLSGLDLGPTSLTPRWQPVTLKGLALLLLSGCCGNTLLAGEGSAPACLAVTCGCLCCSSTENSDTSLAKVTTVTWSPLKGM